MPNARIHLDAPARVLAPGDDGWPSPLDRLGELNLQLRVAGRLPTAPGVAIVGTRYADPEALDFTGHLAAALADAGEWVVSGGALGIDAAAHRGALAAGGHTAAVLATGLSQAYPPRHATLFSELARRGALASETEDDAAPHPGRFLARNRLIAALAWAVVVVQAPLRSGALSTAAWAKRLQIPVFVVPGTPWDPRAEGGLGLAKSGALICTCARDVLSLRPPEGRAAAPASPVEAEKSCNHPYLDAEVQRVVAALGRRALHPDELAARLGLAVAQVQAALLQAELLGVARATPDGRYQIHRS